MGKGLVLFWHVLAIFVGVTVGLKVAGGLLATTATTTTTAS